MCMGASIWACAREERERERERERESNVFPEANSTNVLKTNFRLAVNEA